MAHRRQVDERRVNRDEHRRRRRDDPRHTTGAPVRVCPGDLGATPQTRNGYMDSLTEAQLAHQQGSQPKPDRKEPACVVCGSALTGKQTRFCSEECTKTEKRRRTRERRPARDHVCRCEQCRREMPIGRPRRDDRPPAREFARAHDRPSDPGQSAGSVQTDTALHKQLCLTQHSPPESAPLGH